MVEVSALFAEAVMTPRAWLLWPRDGKAAPHPEVLEARAALEEAVCRSHAEVMQKLVFAVACEH